MEIYLARQWKDIESQDNTHDAVLWMTASNELQNTPDFFSIASNQISSDGYLYVLMPDELEIPAAGWLAYKQWKSAASAETLNLFVREEYDPVEHARRFFHLNRPDWSCDILSAIPSFYFKNPDDIVRVRLEHLLSMLRWAKQFPQRALEYLSMAQILFNEIVSIAPALDYSYQCQAEFFRLAGNPGMAARLLRSIHYVAPSKSIEKQMASLRITGKMPDSEMAAPAFDPQRKPRRILYLIHPRAHYGLDVLYDGLCTVLGAHQITEFPYKPSLHGGPLPIHHEHYPCAFNHPGRAWAIEEIEDALKQGFFDTILYGDGEKGLDSLAVARIFKAAGDIPWFIIDAIDDCFSTRESIETEIGRPATAYFKREMLIGGDYGPKAFPLPFAYPDNRIPPPSVSERSRDLFWAGHRISGLRRLYLEHLESRFGMQLNVLYRQDRYSAMLRESRIGLNCFGFGFDTVRYWELPAHGCMLFSERPPIHIPHNFRDGESAVFFDDLPELDEKMRHYLASPEETERIAKTGYAHLIRHHSASARARQFCGWVQDILSSKNA